MIGTIGSEEPITASADSGMVILDAAGSATTISPDAARRVAAKLIAAAADAERDVSAASPTDHSRQDFTRDPARGRKGTESDLSKPLAPPTDWPRLLAPTTTRKLAQRILAASRITAERMPAGFMAASPWDIMLTLHVAEDDARYLSLSDLDLPGRPLLTVVARWLAALEKEGLIERSHGLIALSDAGDRRVTKTIEAVYDAQRLLD